LVGESYIEPALARWVEDIARLTRPNRIVWCSGTTEEYDSFIKQMLAEGTLIEFNQDEYRNGYLYRSNPNDVARTEKATFICTKSKDDAGPTNNWMDPSRAEKKLWKILRGAMRGRTMYVIPISLGTCRFSLLEGWR
jgi:phosphoenolpyruvate carboxykinase (GTP)